MKIHNSQLLAHENYELQAHVLSHPFSVVLKSAMDQDKCRCKVATNPLFILSRFYLCVARLIILVVFSGCACSASVPSSPRTTPLSIHLKADNLLCISLERRLIVTLKYHFELLYYMWRRQFTSHNDSITMPNLGAIQREYKT